MCNFAINICFKQNMIKIKQFLYLLVLVSFIFSSCKKDDDKDFRDKFEGTYETDIVGLLYFVDAGWVLPMEEPGATENVIVNKLGVNQLMLMFEGRGVYMTVTVDEQGDFSIPPESFKEEDTDDDTGMKLTLYLTVSVTGTITNKTLYIKETYSGNVIIELGMEKIDSKVTGNRVYNGKKIN